MRQSTTGCLVLCLMSAPIAPKRMCMPQVLQQCVALEFPHVVVVVVVTVSYWYNNLRCTQHASVFDSFHSFYIGDSIL